ncbi:sulfatase [Chthoniobacter flavus Ellin428]|uniref:Sulfatase n=1 Tax=Chthoniobacter flavus Ellin428 TaxID=497964 RepID=B4D6C1_9BACT|nr:sulfatase-like hydrolase/transferase [Chthoniobacter flavus]EDY18030.1 sulfatase [Chthoniobacter flavus Ellin428]TCO88272.1 arylsulfatase A-like enzyme [Chthoniobacter flavus]
MKSAFALALALCCATPPVLLAVEKALRPNIVFILVDDMGWGDYGVFYQNARKAANDRSQPWHSTPHLDTLAMQGIQLPNQYASTPVCASSRSSLLLGVTQGHANVRDNQFDKALENNHTLASVLKGAGYATAAFGKWGLQGGPAEKDPASKTATPAQWPGYPTKRGFDFYLGYVRHVDGHFHYPKEDGRQVWENDREISADLAGCYTADLFTARAKKWITDQHTAHPDQPFFCYLALDTPHAKIQYPPCAFPSGGGTKGGLQWLGTPGHMINAAEGTPDSYCYPEYANATWDDDHNPATPEKAWPDVDRRYATAVQRIDDCVGDVEQLLKDLGVDDHTLVIFTSDNGVSNESYLKEPFTPQFFRSFGPFDGIKRDCWEGGVHVGAVARWPSFIPAGTVSHEASSHYDWLTTFAELAGVPVPARADGVSLVPTLRGHEQKRTTPVYMEYFMRGKTPNYAEFLPQHRGRVRDQMQAIRIGDYMGVRYAITSPTAPFEIYNVATDPQEGKNLADTGGEFTALQQRMQDTVRSVRRPDSGAPRPYDDELQPAVKPVTVPGIAWSAVEMAAPWVPRLDDLKPTAQGTAANPDLKVAPRKDDVAVLFSGYVEVPEDGEYQFHVAADTGALLRIGGATVIDADFGYESGQDKSGTVRLQAGRHPFRLYYVRREAGEPRLTFQWNRPGQAPQDIPPGAFSHNVMAAKKAKAK